MTAEEFGTSYFSVRDIKHVQNDLDRFKSQGLNGILHTFSERDSKYYHETMKEILGESKDRNFNTYVNPWGVGNVFGGEALSEFTAHYPDSSQVLSDGTKTPAACFSPDEFKDFLFNWIDKACELNPDYVFWDEPHWFTSSWRSERYSEEAATCFCENCRKEFYDRYEIKMPLELTDRVKEFRRNILNEFIDSMMKRVQKREVRNAVCVQPDSEGKTETFLEDLIDSKHLDTIAVTPFWELHEENAKSFVKKWVHKLRDLARKTDLRTQLWIQGFLMKKEETRTKEIDDAVKIAIEGVDSVFIWGWDGCRTISSIASEDPMDVWETFIEAINRYRP